MLHKLDSSLRLLPKLQVPVDGGRDHKVLPVTQYNQQVQQLIDMTPFYSRHSEGSENRRALIVPCDSHKVEHVPMHVAPFIHIRHRELAEIDTFMGEDWAKNR